MRNQINSSSTPSFSLLSQMLALPQLLRLPNVLMIVFIQFLLYTFILERWAYRTQTTLNLSFEGLVYIMISCGLIAAGGYIINDYYDQEIDEINVPERRVIGRIIQPKTALRTYITLNIIGIIFSIPLIKVDIAILALHIFSIILLWLYAKFFKAIPFLGNLIIAFLCGLMAAEIFVPDNLLFRLPYTLNPDTATEFYQSFAWQYIGFIMYATLLRELSKDVEDIAGDAKGNRLTLPLLIGWSKMRYILIIAHIVLAILLGFKSWNLWQEAQHYTSVYVGCVLCFYLLIPIVLMFRIREARQFKVISRLLKIYFLLGLGWLWLFTS